MTTPGWWCHPLRPPGAMSTRGTPTSTGPFVWSLARALLTWKLVAISASGTRLVGVKPDGGEAKAVAATTPHATPAVATAIRLLATFTAAPPNDCERPVGRRLLSADPSP